VIAIILGWIILNETITTAMVLAMIITIAGVYIVNQSMYEKKRD
jgi:drug/metabolite transporter (DMT)-like permease